MDFEPRLTILHQAGMLSEEDCRKVQDVIRFFQEKYGLTLTEENASAMITHLCAALGRIHRGEPVEPLDEEVYEEGRRLGRHRVPGVRRREIYRLSHAGQLPAPGHLRV